MTKNSHLAFYIEFLSNVQMVAVKGMRISLIERYKQLTNVEADTIRYFVWRMITREEEWFEKGLKELACCIKRHKKSIGKAIDSLEKKGMIRTEKKDNKLWIKLTLTNDELNTRIAYIDPMFCNAQSIQELQSDLLSEIERLEKEIIVTIEVNVRKQKKEMVIDTILDQVSETDIEELVRSFVELTYANSNMSQDERIEKALDAFRTDVFGNQEDAFEDEEETSNDCIKKVYERFW